MQSFERCEECAIIGQFSGLPHHPESTDVVLFLPARHHALDSTTGYCEHSVVGTAQWKYVPCEHQHCLCCQLAVSVLSRSSGQVNPRLLNSIYLRLQQQLWL